MPKLPMVDISKLNYIIDILMLVVFILVSITSIILLLQEDQRGFHQEFYFRKHDIRNIHKWSGLLFIILLTLHLLLHAKWLYNMTKYFFIKKQKGKK